MKKMMLVSTLLLVHAGAYSAAPTREPSAPIGDFGAQINVNTSAGAQRIVDSWFKLSESPEIKAQGEKFSNDVTTLFGTYVKGLIAAFLQEIQPSDAQKLLPLLDAVGKLIQQGFSTMAVAQTMSPEELQQAQGKLQMQAFTVFPLIAEYIPAFTKHAEAAKEKAVADQAKNIEIVQKVVTDQFNDIRTMIEQKAQTK